MKNNQRTRTEVAVACGDPLTAHQREFLDQDANTAATAQDFEILNLRLGQLGSQEGVVPENVRMQVAEIPQVVSPRRVPSRKLGYALATVLAVAIVSGPFVSVIQSRVAQKQSGKSIWDTSLKGKAIDARIIGARENFRLRMTLSKALSQKSLNESEIGRIKIEKNPTSQSKSARIYVVSTSYADPKTTSETGSNFIPFVTLEGCRKGYGSGGRELSETRREATFEYSEYSFERPDRNQLVRVVVHPAMPIVNSLRFLRRKDVASPYVEEEAIFLTVRGEKEAD